MRSTLNRISQWAGRTIDHPWAPSIMVILSGLCFVTTDATIQHLEGTFYIPPAEVVLIRMFGTLVVALIYLYRMTSTTIFNLMDRKYFVSWIRGAECVISLILAYGALDRIPLSEALVVYHIRPIPTAFICFLFLREIFTRIQAAACLISFAAVILVYQPPFLFGESNGFSSGMDVASDQEAWRKLLGFMLMGGSMIFGAIDVLLMRIIGNSTDTMSLLAIYAASAMVVCPIWSCLESQPIIWSLPGIAWLDFVIITLMGFLAQVLYTLAIKRETGGKVALLGYFQVIFAVGVQFLTVGTYPNWTSLLGMTVIIFAGIWAAVWGKPVEAVGEKITDEEEYIPVPGYDVDVIESMALGHVQPSEEE